MASPELTESGSIGGPVDKGGLPSPLPLGGTNQPSEPGLILNSGKRALRCLVSRAIPQDELPSLIETVVSDAEAADIVKCLQGSDVQTFIDVVAEVRYPSSIPGGRVNSLLPQHSASPNTPIGGADP